MGCGGSKEKEVKEENPGEGGELVENENEPVEAPSRLEGDPNKTEVPHSMRRERDSENADDNVILPKGDWVRAKDTPYYYSQIENLYYHPPSCQFYDPTNEMWYDSEKGEWYRDDEDDIVAED